jgi:hypothetical protein
MTMVNYQSTKSVAEQKKSGEDDGYAFQFPAEQPTIRLVSEFI